MDLVRDEDEGWGGEGGVSEGEGAEVGGVDSVAGEGGIFVLENSIFTSTYAFPDRVL